VRIVVVESAPEPGHHRDPHVGNREDDEARPAAAAGAKPAASPGASSTTVT
jgi:hypothetical protein